MKVLRRSKALKVFPLYKGDLLTGPMFNLTYKHLDLWDRIFFVIWKG